MKDDVFIKCEKCRRHVMVIRDVPGENRFMLIGKAFCQRCKKLYSQEEVEGMKKYRRERRV